MAKTDRPNINWRRVYARMGQGSNYRDMNFCFLVGVWKGMSILDAYRNSDDSRAHAGAKEAQRTVATLLRRQPEELWPLFSQRAERRAALAVKAECEVEQQLESQNWQERQAAVNTISQWAGLNAPTKVQVDPGVQTRDFTPLVSARAKLLSTEN